MGVSVREAAPALGCGCSLDTRVWCANQRQGLNIQPVDASLLVNPAHLATVVTVLPMRDRVERKEKGGEGKGKREGGREDI